MICVGKIISKVQRLMCWRFGLQLVASLKWLAHESADFLHQFFDATNADRADRKERLLGEEMLLEDVLPKCVPTPWCSLLCFPGSYEVSIFYLPCLWGTVSLPCPRPKSNGCSSHRDLQNVHQNIFFLKIDFLIYYIYVIKEIKKTLVFILYESKT